MSVTFHIACLDCKKQLWIGQRRHIYSEPEKLKRLAVFLHEHAGHRLMTARENMHQYEEWDFEDFEEVEDDEDET